MKRYPLKVLLAALAVENGASLMSSSVVGRAPSSAAVSTIAYPAALFSSPQDDFCLDSSSVFVAYDEWRKKFGKGDFDPVRFKNFESNFKVLTVANIKARDKALAEGRTLPEWLELNEFGDYSREEYQAMKMSAQQQAATSNTVGGQSARPIRRTQVIKPPQSWGAQGTQQTTSNQGPGQSISTVSSTPSDNFSPSQMPWGSPIPLRKNPTNPQPKKFAPRSSINELYGPPTSSRSARTDDTRGQDSTFETKVDEGNALPSSSTPKVSKASISELYGPPSSPTNDIGDPTSSAKPSFGTQVIRKSETPTRGTQVIARTSSVNELYGPPSPSSDIAQSPNPTFGTQVIRKNEAPTRGTQVITRASSVNDLYGPPNPTDKSNETTSPPFGTQVIRKNDDPARGTQVIAKASSVNELYGPPNPSSNTIGSASPTFGTQVIRKNLGTQVISRASSINELYGPPSPSSADNSSPNPTYGTQVIRKSDSPASGTQVIARASSINELYGPPSPSKSDSDSPNPTYGTQVIRKSDTPARGTQVIARASSVSELYGPPSSSSTGSESPFGTQVIRRNESPSRGTQVIARASSVNELYGPPGPSSADSEGPTPTFGTQVIRTSDTQVRGTQVISRASSVNDLYGPPSASSPGSGAPNPTYGTQVIRRNEPSRGTQVIARASSVNEFYGSSGTPDIRGTQVIRKASDQPTDRGTRVIQKAGEQLPAGFPYSDSGVSKQGSEPIRGTQVIRQAGQVPPPQGASASDDTSRGTYVITPGANKPVADSGTWDANQYGQGGTESSAQQDSNPSGGTQVLRKVGESATASIFSFFGGSKVANEPPTSASGTVKVQGDAQTASNDGNERPRTVLIDKADFQNIVPSIFSFFGATNKSEGDKTNDDAGPAATTTAVTPTIDPAKSKAPSRPTVVIDKNSVDFPRNRVLPEVRRWWQNADGSITGYIYNSQDFNDGTKLTTSPLQRAACRPGNIVRSGNKEYLLM